MSRRVWGLMLIVMGILAVLVSLLADTIGLGAQAGIIGWKQILGAVVGVVLLGVGLFMARGGS